MSRSEPVKQESRFASAVPTWAALCFVLSGAAGLLYEVVWSKQIAYLLGSSLHSVAVVVAAFLGGLALGARFLGGPLTRSGEPGRRYAMLELAVAGAGLLILPLLRAVDPVVGQLYRSLGGESAAFAITRVVLVFVLLVPPAALMGATLPVLVARCERGALGAGLAWLYALNTLGAVAGSLLGGFLLLPGWGLTRSTFAAAALNLVAAAVAWRASARLDRASRPDVASSSPPAAWLPATARRVLGAVFALSGFAALVLQLAWVRLFGLVLGSTVYSFSAVLGVYLAGIALGSALVSGWLGRVRSARVLALAQFVIAIASLLGIQAWPGLPGAMLALGERIGTSWSGLLIAQLGLVVPVLGVPCLVLGAIFPLTTRLLQHGESGSATGRAYALNTLGTIAGSLVAGFVLLPGLGIQGSVQLAAALSCLAGLACLWLPGTGRPARGWLVAAAVALSAAGLAAAIAPRWDPMLMSLGTYRPSHARNLLESFRRAGGGGDPTRRVAAAQKVLFYREGLNASVLVSTDFEGRRRWMRVGGKIDAGTGDMLTQVMLGLLPAAMADTGARTLIVGHGSGATAAAALAAGSGPTEIVELEPAVIAGSRYFHEPGRDPLDDPRVTLHLEDARTRLMHGAGGYDLIISEPTNPWIAGVNSLFTVDFYRRVRAQLASDGVFGQWIQVYELSPATFHTLLRSFLEVFPEAQVYCMWNALDVLLIAAPSGRSLSLERLETPAAQEQVRRARLEVALQISEFYVGPASSLAALVADAPLNTDDRPIVEYRSPRDVIEVGRDRAGDRATVVSELPRTVDFPAGGPLADWPRARVLRIRAEARLTGAGDAEAARVFEELRDAGSLELARDVAYEWSANVQKTKLASTLADARRRLQAGDAQSVRPALEQAAASGSANAELWLLLAEARRQTGDVRGAGLAAQQVLRSDAGGVSRIDARLLYGMSMLAQGHTAEALASFREAQRLAPREPRGYDLEARLHATTGSWAQARDAVERGLRAIPGDPTLTQAAQAIARQMTSQH
jgi:spermidine synthase